MPGRSVRALLSGLPGANALDTAEITARFGADVATLVTGVARMDEIRALPPQGDADERAAQAERLRKMLLAMVEDIRVVLIKLAERTAALRYLMTGGTERQELRERTAREVLDLFAPLANRLGVWQLKWELEDLSLRALEPETYKAIARMLDERRLDRQRYIEDIVVLLQRELAAAGIRSEVTGRPKHIYSIWNKMRRKQSGIDALYDIRAVRILVDDVKDCYTALGIVHHLWTPLPREFDDYIAKPKANNYRSLHTAVHRPRGEAARGADPDVRDAPGTPSTASPRTGATRKDRRRACAAIPRSRTASRGCGRCSNGRTRSPMPPSGSPRSRAVSSRTRSTC